MTTSASIDHIGIGVSDLVAAKRFYDEFFDIVGLAAWFPADEHQFNYGPPSAGTQIFFYRAESTTYTRTGTGLQHLAFRVPARSVVEAAHAWAVEQGCIVVHGPRAFPEYGEHTYASYVLDRHGIMLEVVCHEPEAGVPSSTGPLQA
jgi:catechol 2,3-dioxygenase-like lactoylglutathione lyase family enzyme